MTAVVITRDLMDGGRFRAALADVTIVRSADAPEVADASMILLDLALGLDVAEVVAIGPPVVVYGAHVDTDALKGALTAGCVDAVPRSRVFKRAAELLS